jgi:CBS domain-containing protein
MWASCIGNIDSPFRQLIRVAYHTSFVRVQVMILKVEDVMVESVITVDAESTVMQAVKVMNAHEIGCVVVTRKGRAVGIITERDLLKRVIAKSENAGKMKVKEIMTKPLIAGQPEMDLEEATRLMFDKKIKKLPVVENGKLLGLITLTDVARFQPQMIRIIKKLSDRVSAPKRMEKVVNYYVV